MYMPSNMWTGSFSPNTNTHKFHICYFRLNNYGGETLLSFAPVFNKTIKKIRLCHKSELFLTQNKENITLHHNEERITKILGSIINLIKRFTFTYIFST